MPFEERCEILEGLACVHSTTYVEDTDATRLNLRWQQLGHRRSRLASSVSAQCAQDQIPPRHR